MSEVAEASQHRLLVTVMPEAIPVEADKIVEPPFYEVALLALFNYCRTR